MSANKCKFCNGSGWYEPKNMGGMMVEPCNRCDAHKKNQAAQKPSADVCPVCGCGEPDKLNPWFACGGCLDGSDCENGARVAIERAVEIERLNGEKAELLALCKRLAALPGDYNTIQDAEFVFRDLNAVIAKHTPQLCRDDRRNQSNQET